MKSSQAWTGIVVSVVAGALVAVAVSDGGARSGGVPVFAVCAMVAFAVNWLVFVPSNAARTEQFYDLTGAVTYLTVIAMALMLADDPDARAVVVAAMVAVWSVRLGSFLFRRIRHDGRDRRFDAIKHDTVRFLLAWTMQALWVILTAACALAIITGGDRESFGPFAVVGSVVWAVGFAIEVVADRQKSTFRRDPANADRFVSTGLWAWSRHPNYFGEITLWVGVAVIALPVLSGWRWVALVSPVFVTVLLTRISGVPMLERRAARSWGEDPAYQAYVSGTPVLVPRPPG